MKQVLGCVRRADQDFGMIARGDRVVVGVSGGKDSLVLLYALSLYRKFCANSFELSAVTLGMGLSPVDFSPVAELCQRLEVPYTLRETDIGDVVFNKRREKNPCALCSTLRRGALTNFCQETGANKLALGHHRDDAIETLMMSLLFEGRLHTFHPVTYLSKQQVTQNPAYGVFAGKGDHPRGPEIWPAGDQVPLPRQRRHQAGGDETAAGRSVPAVSPGPGIHAQRPAQYRPVRPVGPAD